MSQHWTAPSEEIRAALHSDDVITTPISADRLAALGYESPGQVAADARARADARDTRLLSRLAALDEDPYDDDYDDDDYDEQEVAS